MPVAPTDLQFRLSGGGSNSSAAASLGGAISATAVPAALFDDVGGDEAAAGRVEYRCWYIRNNHATLTAIGVKVWLSANTPEADTTIDIGLGSAAISATEQAVANETAAPAGVTFSAAANEGAALSIGDLAPGAHKAIWERRTVSAGAAGVNGTSYTRRVKCDTLP